MNKRLGDLEKDNRKLQRQIAKRDANIDFLEIKHRELAQKAIDAGVKDVYLDAPFFKFEEDEEI
jgi:hypothetical protein